MKKIYFTSLILSVALTACNKTEFQNMNAPAVSGVPIEFSIDDATKALLDLGDGKTVSWQDGDVVGLFQAYGDNYGTWAETAMNVPYRYSAETGKFHPVNEPALWAGSPDDKNKICVYYPYNEECTDPNRVKNRLLREQTYDAAASSWNMGSGYGFASIMVKDVTWGEPVSLPALNQLNAILRLNITNNSGETITISQVETQVEGSKWLTASYILQNISNSPATQTDNGTVYKSITTTVENGQVAPGEAIDVRVVFRAADLSSTNVTVNVTSDQGEHPAIVFKGGNIGKGATAVKQVTLEPVEEASYSIGDEVDGGVLFWMSDDASTGKVLYPTKLTSRWHEGEAVPNSVALSNRTDGDANVEQMKSIDPTLANFNAAYACEQLGAGWYLPARDEFVSMLNGLGIDALKDQFGFTLSSATKASSAGSGARVWTSETGSNGTMPRFIIVTTASNSVLNDATKGTNEYTVRCIKKVDLTSDAPAQEEDNVNFNEAGQEGGYDVYLLIGQSNMAGRGDLISGDEDSIEGAYLLNASGNVVQATNPMNQYSTVRKNTTQGINPGLAFSKTIYQKTGRKVLLVVNARGGSSINYWVKDMLYTNSEDRNNFAVSGDHYLYNEAVSRAKEAMKYGTLKAILWHQGESDKSDANYMTKLSTLVSSLRSDLGNVPFVAGQIATWRTNVEDFNQRISTISSVIDNSDYISSAIPEGTDVSEWQWKGADDPHFSRSAQLVLGGRYAQKILKMVYDMDITVE